MASIDVIRDLIGGGLVAYNRPVATRFGVNAAVLLHELAYWCQRSDDGWCYRTQNEIQESTGMSAEVQHTARKILKAAGVIEERREGIPARLFYCIDYDALVVALDTAEAQNQESSNPDTVVVKPGNSNRKTANPTYKASKTKQVEEQVDIGRNPKRTTQLPDDFEVTDAMRQWAADELELPSLRVDRETAQFMDHHTAKGSTFKDWPAAWRTWMRNSVKFASKQANGRTPQNGMTNAELSKQAIRRAAGLQTPEPVGQVYETIGRVQS